jgi:hypothetical protein
MIAKEGTNSGLGRGAMRPNILTPKILK